MENNIVVLSDDELSFIVSALEFLLSRAHEHEQKYKSNFDDTNNTLYEMQNLYNRLLNDHLKVPKWYNSNINYFDKKENKEQLPKNGEVIPIKINIDSSST